MELLEIRAEHELETRKEKSCRITGQNRTRDNIELQDNRAERVGSTEVI